MLITVSLSAALLLPGCNIVAPAVVVAAGPTKVDARHTLADVPTVVFIDDRMSHLDPASLRRAIADKVNSELMSNEVLTKTISPQDAMLIASRNDRASDMMAIEDVGKAVGAQQVIYVEIAQFKHTPDGYTPRPFAQANVKVIDVAARQRVFPDANAPAGWSVQVVGAPVDPSLYASRATRLKIHETLAGELGDEIAKVFYKHEYKEIGTRVGGSH